MLLLHILSELCTRLEALTDIRKIERGQPILTDKTICNDMKRANIIPRKNTPIDARIINSRIGKLLFTEQSREKYVSVWINYEGIPFQSPDPKASIEIELLQLITENAYSNGLPCNIAVFQAKMGNLIMSLKFREVNSQLQNENFSEQEGNKAMNTEYDRNINILFPRLFCMVDLYINRFPPNPPSHWEAIGTEFLLELTPEDRQHPLFYTNCFNTLQRLHDAGYAHRDPHSHNFMKNQNQFLKLIDQDEIIPLPIRKPIIVKFLCILDFLELLFWANPYCAVFPLSHTNWDEYLRQLTMAYNASVTHEIYLVPNGYAFYKKVRDLNQIEAILKQETIRKGGQTYRMYLESLTLESIATKFRDIFSSASNMRAIRFKVDNTPIPAPPPLRAG